MLKSIVPISNVLKFIAEIIAVKSDARALPLVYPIWLNRIASAA